MRALYFPYIRVPQTQWFAQALLYWDEVGAIVPYEFMANPDRLGPHMVEPLREELLVPVFPGEHLHRIPRFTTSFLAHIDANATAADILSTSARPRWIRIHLEKLGDLADELEARNLARAIHAPWYDVEPHTAAAFMAYLATVLGQLPGRRFTPITDRRAALAPFATNSQIPHAVLLHALRALVFREVLPIPAEWVRATEIARFKHDHHVELRRFRAEIEVVAAEAAAVPDAQARKALLNAKSNQLKVQADEIAGAMQARRWPRIVFGTVCSLVGCLIPAVQLRAGMDPFSGLGAGAGLANAVYNAFGDRAQSEMLQRPMAYAALARTHLRSGSIKDGNGRSQSHPG